MTNKLLKLKGGWRFIVVLVMVCTLASTLMVTSTATPVAAATNITVSVSPNQINMASTQFPVVVSVKNNNTGTAPLRAINKILLTLPSGFSVASIPVTSGWKVLINTSSTITWVPTATANNLAVGATKPFGVFVNAPECDYGFGYSFVVQYWDTGSYSNSNCAYVEILDCPPAFNHEPLPCQSDEIVQICTQITQCNDKLNVSTPRIFWDNGSGWQNASLEYNTCTDLWCYNISLADVDTCTEIKYYFYAEDCAGYAAYSPADAPTSYYSFMYADVSGPTIIDFTNTSTILDCMTGGSTVNVSWNVSAACCPAEGITVDILFVNSDGIQKCLLTDQPSRNESGIATGTATVTLPMVNINSSYLQLVAHDCCGCNEGSPNIDIPCIQSPLTMFDAITGWHWVWAGYPGNYNDRTSIMVIFNKDLDPTTVNASDFTVTSTGWQGTVISAEVHNTVFTGMNNGQWSVVFLTLSAPLATDALPTVNLIGSVSTGSTEGPCQAVDCETITGKVIISEDGIAPILTLTTSPANPGYNQLVTVTLTSTETLLESCLDLCDEGKNGDNVRVWVEGSAPKDVHMTPNPQNGKVWTGTFTNENRPGYEWRLEAEACQCMNPCDEWQWKEDKCGEASLIFDGYDVLVIDVCEGWNLISVPDTLVEPSIQKAFSRFTSEDEYGPVTKVYYFTGGTAGTWSCAVLNPVTGLWTGTGGLTTIDPGKAYWVWCDDTHLELVMRLAPPRTGPVSMPTIPVQAGWNMIGFVDIGHNGPMLAPDYLASILTLEKQAILYRYETCGFEYGPFGGSVPPGKWWSWNLVTTIAEFLDLGDTPIMIDGMGYWLAVQSAGTIFPPSRWIGINP